MTRMTRAGKAVKRDRTKDQTETGGEEAAGAGEGGGRSPRPPRAGPVRGPGEGVPGWGRRFGCRGAPARRGATPNEPATARPPGPRKSAGTDDRPGGRAQSRRAPRSLRRRACDRGVVGRMQRNTVIGRGDDRSETDQAETASDNGCYVAAVTHPPQSTRAPRVERASTARRHVRWSLGESTAGQASAAVTPP